MQTQTTEPQKIFVQRLNTLMEENRTTQEQLAKAVGVRRQTISLYCNGQSKPDYLQLTNIAQYYSVSTDYLVGLSNNPNRIPSAVDDLGLSAKAVQYLKILNDMKVSGTLSNDKRLDIISYWFESKDFDFMLSQCVSYIRLMNTPTDKTFWQTNEWILCKDFLSEHGFTISTPKDQAQSIFSESIVTFMRQLLGEMIDRNSNEQQQE